VFNCQIDFIDESIRELLDVSMISLVIELIRKDLSPRGSSKSEPLHENHWQARESWNPKVPDAST
jgi:phage terminase large subunit